MYNMKIRLNNKAYTGLKLLLFLLVLAGAGFFVFNVFGVEAQHEETGFGGVANGTLVNDTAFKQRIFNETITFTIMRDNASNSSEPFEGYAFAFNPVMYVIGVGNATTQLYDNTTDYNYTYNETHITLNGTNVNMSGDLTTAPIFNITYMYRSNTTGGNFSFVYPENNTIYYQLFMDSEQSNLTIETNWTFQTCEYMFNNNGTYIGMVSDDDNNTWWNETDMWDFDNVSLAGLYTNISFKCYNVTNTSVIDDVEDYTEAWPSNITFTNSSLYRWKISDDVPTYTILSDHDNYANYSQINALNFTTSTGVRNCTIVLNDSATAILMTNTSILNQTEIVFWGNVSTLEEEISFDSLFQGPTYNLTWYCEDAYGNVTWFNSTNDSARSGQQKFWIDGTKPILTIPDFAISNYSTGQWINISWVVNDTTEPYCYVRAFHQERDATVYSWSTEYLLDASEANVSECYINVTPSDVEEDGLYIFEAYAADQAGNFNVTDLNYTFVLYRLKDGWNLVSIPYNYSMSEIGAMTSTITYVSTFNNSQTYKTYDTHTVGGTTNADFQVNMSNATYVYVSSDTVFMMNYSAIPGQVGSSWENATLYTNTSSLSAWNQISILVENVTLNQTLYNGGGCVNFTETTAGLMADGWLDNLDDCENVTMVSFYDAQLGKYCSAVKGSGTTSCYPDYTVENLTIPYGSAIWISVNENVTYNRTVNETLGWGD